MPLQIALLRGINVAGKNRVAMSDLRVMLADLGFADAQSLLQSGNLVFHAERPTGTALERLLESETKKRLGVAADYLVRTAAEWRKIVARNPFPREARDDPGHLVVMCLKGAPSAANVRELQAAIQGRETLRADGQQLYIVYPDGIGRSKLTGTLIEKKLALRGTARNWNTVLKLAELIESG